MGPEVKLYKKLKAFTPQIIWNRIENLSLPGMPDLLGYNNSGRFFTVELKVTKGRKIRFSPHQIAWHVTHPKNTFIIAEALGPRSSKLIQMFRGSRIMELAACGLELEALCVGLGACSLMLQKLGAWGLPLGASFSQLSSPYNILGVWIPLVLAVYNTFRVTVPTLPAI